MQIAIENAYELAHKLTVPTASLKNFKTFLIKTFRRVQIYCIFGSLNYF